MTERHLFPMFIPALVTILLHSEKQKGAPLTEQEVLEIRDKGACVMMPVEDIRALAEKRGYVDLDPENVWAGWQQARTEIAGV